MQVNKITCSVLKIHTFTWVILVLGFYFYFVAIDERTQFNLDNYIFFFTQIVKIKNILFNYKTIVIVVKIII